MLKNIGNTPMIKIIYKNGDNLNYIYTKLEYYNPTGSIKDRMVNYILDKAKVEGTLKDNMPIIEATSGNTGIAIASYGARYNHPVYIFMPDFVSGERIKIMEMFGANVITRTKEEGGFKKCIEDAKRLKERLNGYSTDQFNNIDNIMAHYNTTAKEIDYKLKNIDYFISGIGTGGTLIGIGKYLKEKQNTKVIALEPETLAMITNGIKQSHKIEGIGDDFIPSIVDLELLDDVILIDDKEAINMASKIAKELGLGVGISSGANLLASILINNNNRVVTVFPDDNKKYISTDLSKFDYNGENLISNQIELLSYEVL